MTDPHPLPRSLTRPFALLLKLLPEPGARGDLVGHVEVIATSEVVAIGTGADLVALVQRISRSGDDRPDGHTD